MGLWEEMELYFTVSDCGGLIYCDSPEQTDIEIEQLSANLKRKYGAALPIYQYEATEKKTDHKTFYLSLMGAANCRDVSTKDPVFLHQILTQHIQIEAAGSRYKKAVLIIRNAERLSEKQYNWLIDIYNELYQHNVVLSTLFFGSSKLKEEKKKYRKKGKDQIVQRYMVKEVTC